MKDDFTEVIAIADVPNANGHIYPRAELERAMTEFMHRATTYGQTAPGMNTAESLMAVPLHKVSHELQSIWWEENVLMGRIKLLPTEEGKYAQELFERAPNSFTLGMACIGEVDENEEISNIDLISVNVLPKQYTNH
ncbi:MAG: hypothetical protein KAS32_28840 [Candidatus Peribacteraceae bacterium]|nr:hypothetical protein [Candidatus Peribacteraceae bacterium]